jgi:hypothetical protein
MNAAHGERDPAGFAAEVREKARAREMKAARSMIGGLRRVAADLRAMGERQQALETLERGLALVPAEAAGPIHEMRAQLLEEMSSRGTPVEPGPEGSAGQATPRVEPPPSSAPKARP